MEVCCFVVILVLIFGPLIARSYSKSEERRKIAEEVRKRQEAEHRRRLEEHAKQKAQNASDRRYRYFAASIHFELVEQFANKYAQNWSDDEIASLRSRIEASKENDLMAINFGQRVGERFEQIGSLRELLKKKGWIFTHDEILTMVSNSRRFSRIQKGKERLLSTNLKTQQELFNRFFELTNSNDNEMLAALTIAVNEFVGKKDKTKPKIKLEEIKRRVLQQEKERELLLFEKKLSDPRGKGDDASTVLLEIDSMTGSEFENFLAGLFANMGYEVTQTKMSGDQGAGLIISKFGEVVVVQAKRSSRRVGDKAVQEVVGAIAHYKAEHGIVVANSSFTTAAANLATSNRIDLIDRNELHNLIVKYW